MTLRSVSPLLPALLNGKVRTLAVLSVIVAQSGACSPAQIDLTRPEQALNPPPTFYDDRPWATVLRENVRDGLVDYNHLAAHPEPLHTYLQTLASLGPQSTPHLFKNRNDRLCYYINAYNAAVLAAVLHAQIPPSMHTHRTRSLDYRYRVVLEGRSHTLVEVRALAEAQAKGDVRLVFSLCDAAKGSPPLYEQPLRPIGLEETLRLLAQKAMDNPNIVRVDHERQRLLLAVPLFTRRHTFIEFYKRRTGAKEATMLNVVLHLASRVRRQWLNTAVGYPERLIPFDRMLNRWTPSYTTE